MSQPSSGQILKPLDLNSETAIQAASTHGACYAYLSEKAQSACRPTITNMNLHDMKKMSVLWELEWE